MITVYGGENIKERYNENDFSPAEGKTIQSYARSKILAEQCIIDFRKTIPSDSPLEIMTVHPGLVTGKFFNFF